MTLEEKRKAVMAYCSGHGLCSQGHPTSDRRCPLRDFAGNCLTGAESIERNFKILCEAGVLSETEAVPDPETVPNPRTNPAPEFDPVNRPKHYNREGAMESIDEMVLVFGPEAVMHFCLCNAWKYRYRATAKNGEEDLKKSDWYMRKYKELKEAGHDPT